jgi:hypothetical protein
MLPVVVVVTIAAAAAAAATITAAAARGTMRTPGSALVLIDLFVSVFVVAAWIHTLRYNKSTQPLNHWID